MLLQYTINGKLYVVKKDRSNCTKLFFWKVTSAGGTAGNVRPKASSNAIILQQRGISDSWNTRQLFVTKDFLANLKEDKTWRLYQTKNYIKIWRNKKNIKVYTSLILISFKFWTQFTQKQTNLNSKMVPVGLKSLFAKGTAIVGIQMLWFSMNIGFVLSKNEPISAQNWCQLCYISQPLSRYLNFLMK